MKPIKPATALALGRLLRNNRKRLNLSVRYVAAQSSVKFGYLASVERGEVERPKIKMLEALASMYGLNPDDIIIMAGKIPSDVYWKVVRCPELIEVIRKHQE